MFSIHLLNKKNHVRPWPWNVVGGPWSMVHGLSIFQDDFLGKFLTKSMSEKGDANMSEHGAKKHPKWEPKWYQNGRKEIVVKQ